MTTKLIFQQTYVWEYEKGITNNKSDKGGPTNDGITYKHYTAYCMEVLGRKPSYEHFVNLTAEEIYKFYERVWRRMSCDKIDNMLLAGVCFDFGFNSEFAKREIQELLQKLGYKLDADNVFGPKTIATLNEAYKKHKIYLLYLIFSQRVAYVTSLVYNDATQIIFLAGWLNRIADWIKFVQRYG